jgi:carboxyl-terminal processing protease
MAMHAMASPFVPTVLISFMPALNLGSMIPMTMGMEPGLANPLWKQMGQFTMGDTVVMINMLPAIALTHQTSGNMMNNAMGAVLVPSVTNVFFSFAAGPDAAVDADDLRALDRAVAADVPDEADEWAGAQPAVHGARILADGVGYVAVARLSTAVPSAFHHTVTRLLADGMEALVLDLRGNRGGDAMAALALAGDFVAPGTVLAVTLDGDGDATFHRARGSQPHAFPLAILVDRGTASAAEVLAGSLQAQGRALVLGETTYGKSAASAVVRGPGGLRYDAVARFVFPTLPVRPDLALDALMSTFTQE